MALEVCPRNVGGPHGWLGWLEGGGFWARVVQKQQRGRHHGGADSVAFCWTMAHQATTGIPLLPRQLSSE